MSASIADPLLLSRAREGLAKSLGGSSLSFLSSLSPSSLLLIAASAVAVYLVMRALGLDILLSRIIFGCKTVGADVTIGADAPLFGERRSCIFFCLVSYGLCACCPQTDPRWLLSTPTRCPTSTTTRRISRACA